MNSSHKTLAERLPFEENEDRHNKQNVNPEELISSLTDFLQNAESSVATHEIMACLAELGFETEEGFAKKSVAEMIESVRELITSLEEASSGVLKVTNSVRENIAGATNATPETTEEADKIRSTLEKLTEGRFLSVEGMNEALKSLKGVEIEISADEITRLNVLFPKELSQETLAKIESLKNQTEGEKGPLIMQLPAKVMVDGEEMPFTIVTLQKIMQKVAAVANKERTPMEVSDDVPEEIKNRVWEGALMVWTPACLKGSKNKNYKKQLQYQTSILGSNTEIGADMFLAMILSHISGKEALMPRDFMRLNSLSRNNAAIRVDYLLKHGVFRLLPSATNDDSGRTGIGGSFKITD